MSTILALLILSAPPICEQATPLDKRERAPCSGILIPESWAVELVQLREVDLPTCRAMAEKEKKTGAASLARCHQERAAIANALRATDRALEHAQKQPKAPAWYESKGLWFSAGLVVGAVAVGTAAR